MFRVIKAGVYGNTDDGFRTGYDFTLLDVDNDFNTPEEAYKSAWEYLEHDDFLIGEIVDDKLVNVLTGHGKPLSGWQDSDYQSVANSLEIEWGPINV